MKHHRISLEHPITISYSQSWIPVTCTFDYLLWNIYVGAWSTCWLLFVSLFHGIGRAPVAFRLWRQCGKQSIYESPRLAAVIWPSKVCRYIHTHTPPPFISCALRTGAPDSTSGASRFGASTAAPLVFPAATCLPNINISGGREKSTTPEQNAKMLWLSAAFVDYGSGTY